MILRRSAAVVVAVAMAAGLAQADPPVLDDAETQRHVALAERFYQREMFYRAIGVLEELRLFAPTSALQTWAHLRIAMAYQRGGQYTDAVATYDALLASQAVAPPDADLARIQRAVAHAEQLVHEPDRRGARDVIAELGPLADAGGAPGFHAAYQRARLAMLVGDRAAVTHSLAQVRATCTLADACDRSARLAAALALPAPSHRHAPLAVGLSVVIPGLGSIYARHYVDGIYYGGLTTLAALGAYDVYDRGAGLGHQRPTFWGLAGLATVFYLSNLLHAYTATQRFNAVERYRWQERIWTESELPLPLEARPAP